MEPSMLAPGARKPPRWWIIVTAVAGAVGALSAIAAGGKGTYDISPFTVELRAWPAAQGKTEFAIKQVSDLLVPSHAEAGTHRSPIAFRATIVGITDQITAADVIEVADPKSLADKLAEDGKDAAKSFGIKLGLLAVSGSIAAGVALSMFGMRWRRVVGALLAGVLTFGVVGLLVQQTYDKGEFAKTRFVRDDCGSPGGLLCPGSSVPTTP